MRRSVVVLFVIGVVVAVGFLVFGADHVAKPEVRPDATPRATSIDETSRMVTELRAAIPPASVEPPAPRPSIDRYLSDDRLLAAFETLRRSTTGGDPYAARRIEQSCFGDTRTTSIVGNILAGRPIQRFDRVAIGTPDAPDGGMRVTQSMPTREQVAAARELLRRCDGFGMRTAQDHRSDRLDLEARLLRTDDVVGIAENIATHRVPPTLDRLRTILASRDPVAITLLDDELTARWQRTSVRPMPTSLFDAPSPVMQLVGCDLGLDCGPDSQAALNGCIDRAEVCGLDVRAQLLRVESPEDRVRMDDLRGRFAAAIDTGDYAVWGL